MIQYNNIDYGCWQYEDAATLMNQAIAARKWEAKYNNMVQLNDSLIHDIAYSNMEFNIMSTNHSLCMANSVDKDQIIENKDIEISNMAAKVKQQKTQKWIAAGLAVVFGYLAITN